MFEHNSFNQCLPLLRPASSLLDLPTTSFCTISGTRYQGASYTQKVTEAVNWLLSVKSLIIIPSGPLLLSRYSFPLLVDFGHSTLLGLRAQRSPLKGHSRNSHLSFNPYQVSAFSCVVRSTKKFPVTIHYCQTQFLLLWFQFSNNPPTFRISSTPALRHLPNNISFLSTWSQAPPITYDSRRCGVPFATSRTGSASRTAPPSSRGRMRWTRMAAAPGTTGAAATTTCSRSARTLRWSCQTPSRLAANPSLFLDVF
jgi:hypothetical protein